MAEDFGLVWLGDKDAEGQTGCSLQLPKKGSREEGADLFFLASCDNMHRKGSKLHQERLRLNIRKYFFTDRVIVHCNRLSTEMANAPNLSVLKMHLDNALKTCLLLLVHPEEILQLD